MQRTNKRSHSNKSSPRYPGKKRSLMADIEDVEISAPSGSGEESAVGLQTFWKVWNDVVAIEQYHDQLQGKKRLPSASSCDSYSSPSSSSESYSELSGKIKTSPKIPAIEYEKQKEEDWQGVRRSEEDEEMEVPDNSLSNKSDDTLGLSDHIADPFLSDEIDLREIELKSNEGEKEATLDEPIEKERRDNNLEKEEFMPPLHSMSDPDLRALTKSKKDFENFTQLRKTISDRSAQDPSIKQHARNQLKWMGRREYGSFIGSPPRTQQTDSSPGTISASEHRSRLTHSLLTFGKSQMKKITDKIKHSEEQADSPRKRK